MGAWWMTLAVVAVGLVALLLIGAALQERKRDRVIAAREAQLSGIRAEQRQLRTKVTTLQRATADRKKAAGALQKRAPRLRKQLQTAQQDVANLTGDRDQLRAALSSGVLAPGVTP
jgi:peptidoglycan hydrolase CwlO-like protein